MYIRINKIKYKIKFIEFVGYKRLILWFPTKRGLCLFLERDFR